MAKQSKHRKPQQQIKINEAVGTGAKQRDAPLGCLFAPRGAGKSTIATAFARGYNKKRGNPVFFFDPSGSMAFVAPDIAPITMVQMYKLYAPIQKLREVDKRVKVPFPPDKSSMYCIKSDLADLMQVCALLGITPPKEIKEPNRLRAKALVKLIPFLSNCLFVIDEAMLVFPEKLSLDDLEPFIKSGNNSVAILSIFHAVRPVPRKLQQHIDYAVIYNTREDGVSLADIKDRMPQPETVLKAMKALSDTDYKEGAWVQKRVFLRFTDDMRIYIDDIQYINDNLQNYLPKK
jgi:hypothetical protein